MISNLNLSVVLQQSWVVTGVEPLMGIDLELMKAIAFAIAHGGDMQTAEAVKARIIADDLTKEVVAVHCKLLADQGLIEIEDISDFDSADVLVQRMTFKGHEFVAAIQRPGVWQLLRDKFAPALPKVGLPVLTELIKHAINSL